MRVGEECGLVGLDCEFMRNEDKELRYGTALGGFEFLGLC